ncbi:MAG: hypothetical protein ACI86M_002218 [Saprospiraceae bacterium]|jgi:hypothetical protein
MKNLLKFLPFFLMLSLAVISCGEDDPEESSCTTDPAITVAENIIGTWKINLELDGGSDTVTFNADGSGSSSSDSFYFATSNNDKDYNNFNWNMKDVMNIVISYDYSPDTPVLPFINSEGYSVTLNNCDEVQLESDFSGNIKLTK